MKLMFMGTPDFALKSLQALCEAGHDICAVVTREDKPKGRGYAMAMSPVKIYALEKGIPIYQPKSIRSGELDDVLKELVPEVIIVVAYGRILPQSVLDFPKYGCINVHGSLLPEYRGAAPMQRAIIDGKEETGITIMQMDDGIDTGDILRVVRIPIEDTDDFGTIHDRLAQLGAAALLSVLSDIETGNPPVPVKQSEIGATYAAKIEKDDCFVDFSLSSDRVFNLIRGLSPMPLAFGRLNGKIIKFTSAERADGIGRPGTVLSISNGKITVACSIGSIAITGVVPEGKKRMTAMDFINGRGVAVGNCFETGESKFEQ